MTRQISSLLPHRIVALGAAQPDDEKAFRASNAAYRAIRAVESALSMRWLGKIKSARQSPRKTARRVSPT